MSNKITIELCAEDRARLDRLAAAMEKSCAQVERQEAEAIDLDEVQQKLTEAMARASAPAEAPKNAPDEAKAETLTTEPPKEEKPAAKEDAAPCDPIESFAQHEEKPEPVEPTVTLDRIQQKVVQLAAGNGGAKKAKVRAIINAHGARVSDLKEKPEVWAEVWKQLTALERED